MRKVAQEKGECLLVAGTPDHDVILNLFGSPSSFVQWLVSYCVCGLIILSLLWTLTGTAVIYVLALDPIE
jgi:hypothetical protein